MRSHLRSVVVEALELRQFLDADPFIPAPDAVGAVFDPARNRLYVACGTAGQIQPYDLATKTALAPIHVASGIEGLDISPDNASLYTLDASASILYRVDISTGAVTGLPYTTSLPQTGGWNVVVASGGKVFIDGVSDTGNTDLTVYDLATGTSEPFAPQPSVVSKSSLVRSADHRYICGGTSYRLNGDFYEYDTASDVEVASGLFPFGLALNADGSLGVDSYEPVFSRGAARSAGALVQGAPAFVPESDRIVSIDAPDNSLISSDTNGGGVGPTFALQRPLADSGFLSNPRSPTVVSPDGRYAFVAVQDGYEQVDMGSPPPPKLDVAAPTVANEGTTVALSAGSLGNSLSAGTVEWDLAYDGSHFDVDATGRSVSYTAPDGPATSHVAARYRVGSDIGAIATADVSVANVAPTATLSASVDGTGTVHASLGNAVDVPSDLSAGLTYRFDLDGDGAYEISGSAPSASALLLTGGIVTISAQVADKDGATSTYSARVARQATAVISAVPDTMAVGSFVSLDGSGSATTGAAIATYEWDFNYDGSTFTPDVSGATTTYVAPDDGGSALRTIALRITASDGSSALATARVRITGMTTNGAPTATFAASVVDGRVQAGFSGASDVPADLSAGLTYLFDLDGDGNFEVSGSAASAGAPLSPGVHRLAVTGRVQDQSGLFTDYTLHLADALTAAISASASSVDAGGSVSLDASGSGTPGPAISKYEWDFDYDGSVFSPDATGVTTTYVAPDDGGSSSRTIALRVTDADGAAALSTVPVHISRMATTVTFVSADPIQPGSADAPVTVRFHNANGLSFDGLSAAYLSLSVLADGSYLSRTNPTTVTFSDDHTDATAVYLFKAPGARWTRDLMGDDAVSVEASSSVALDGGPLAAQDLPRPVALSIAASPAGEKVADVTTALVSPPADIASGAKTKFTVTASNIGGAKLPSAGTVRLVFSADEILSDDDLTLGSVPLKKGLSPKAKAKLTASLAVPARDDSASGYLFAVASDGSGSSRTAVDGVSAPVAVTLHKAYFVALSGAVSTSGSLAIPHGGTTTFAFSVRNAGTLVATGGWYLTETLVQVADDGTESDFDSKDGSTSKIKVGPGKTVRVDRIHMTNDRVEPPGRYYFRFELSYEGNNPDDNGGDITVNSPTFTLKP